VPDTLSLEELTHGPALDDERIDALVAFLKTLTDKRYEDLVEDPARTFHAENRLADRF
jgi:cytochrome c peroxidase